jgi:hypothetical protein
VCPSRSDNRFKIPNLVHADAPDESRLVETFASGRVCWNRQEFVLLAFAGVAMDAKKHDVAFVNHMLPVSWLEQRPNSVVVVKLIDPNVGWESCFELVVNIPLLHSLFSLLLCFAGAREEETARAKPKLFAF